MGIRIVFTQFDISLLLQDNLFEWHFSVRGPPDSDFDGGVYHGRIVLPPEYPMKPPSIILLTVRRQQQPHLTHIWLISRWSGTGRRQIRWWKSGKWTACHLTLSYFWLEHTKWQLSDESLSCHHTVRGNCTGFVRIWECLFLFRHIYGTCTNYRLIKTRVLWIVDRHFFIVSSCFFSFSVCIHCFENSNFCRSAPCISFFNTLIYLELPCQS